MGQSNCRTDIKPKKWQTLFLGDCATLVRQTVLPSEAGDIPYIGLEHIRKGGMRLLGHGKASNVTSMKTPFQSGDILFGKLRPYFCKVVLTSFEGICSTDIWVLRAKRGVDQRFLFYLIASRPFIDFATSSSGGTRMPRAKWSYVSKYEIQLPPLLEQRKIAKILSTCDEVVETIEKLISNAQAQKRALMQRLLTGKCRFSEFKGEWKTVSLKDLLASGKVKGKIVPCNDERRGVPYIGSTSFFGQFGSYTESSKAVLCEPSDILILWDGEYAGKVAIGLRGAVSSTVVRLRVDQKLGNNRFVFYRILFDNPRIRAIREGSGIPHLPGDFEVWYLLSLPCTQEQSKIAENLDNAFEQEDILTRQLALLQRERKVLMQQLLTGKRRVKVEDIVHA